MSIHRLLIIIIFTLTGAMESVAMDKIVTNSESADVSVKAHQFWLDVKASHFPIPTSSGHEETRIVPMQTSCAVSAGQVLRHKTERSDGWSVRFSLQTELPRTFRSARIHYLRNLVVLIISNQAP